MQALDAVGLGDMPLTNNEASELEQLKTDVKAAYSVAITQFEGEGVLLSA